MALVGFITLTVSFSKNPKRTSWPPVAAAKDVSNVPSSSVKRGTSTPRSEKTSPRGLYTGELSYQSVPCAASLLTPTCGDP
ncbi:MAG: hypothetical protein BWY76_01703 [bacterium ADurb.Bin429]|nr:MAG: hypothetical protein BWY76_01703 [bacterium ADurb.Bin429]